jgi:outer membrane protein OmpA-like peptidoglycan-associated protein
MQRPGRSLLPFDRWLLPVVTVCLALFLAACGGAIERPWPAGNTVVVIGNRANMPAPVIGGTAAETLRKAIQSQDKISVVIVSGQPKQIGTLATTSSCDSKMACDPVWDGFQKRIQAVIARNRAIQPEADTLGAIATAARQLQSTSGSKHLIVIDSGLQTAGDMPLQYPGALETDPNAVAQSLAANLALPNLRDVDVQFNGLGSTFAPQSTPGQSVISRLELLWTAVLKASAPKTLHIDTAPLSDNPPAENLPSVTPVSFTPVVVPTTSAEVPQCVRLRADQVGFVGDKDTFRDPGKVKAVLTPIAQRMISDKVTATLTGTTALPDADPDSPRRLSLRRAQAVRKELLGLGVPSSAISAVRGVGTDFPGFVADTDSKGRLIETKAVQNRLVIIELAQGACS